MFRLSSMAVVAEIVATPLGAMMVTSNPWIPYMLGLVIMIVSSCFVLIMPETLNQMGDKDGIQQEDSEESDESSTLLPAKNETVTQIIVVKAQEFISSSKFLWTSPRILITVVAAFAGSLDNSSAYLLIQYVSAKFHCTIAEVCIFFSTYLFELGLIDISRAGKLPHLSTRLHDTRNTTHRPPHPILFPNSLPPLRRNHKRPIHCSPLRHGRYPRLLHDLHRIHNLLITRRNTVHLIL